MMCWWMLEIEMTDAIDDKMGVVTLNESTQRKRQEKRWD